MRRRSLEIVLALLAAAPGCEADPSRLTWEIAFASRALRDRAAMLEARIVQGGCASSQLVYVSAFEPDEAGTSPPELDKGKYGFVVRALDAACYWYAEGCTEAELPRGGPVMVRVGRLARETLDCDGHACSSALCASARDAGDADAGSLADAGFADGGLDAGSAGRGGAFAPPPDAGEDEGGTDAAPPPEPVVISLEVEHGDPVSAPFVVVPDDLASGGAYVSRPVPEGATLDDQRSMKRGTPPADDAEGGIARLSFDLPRTARYRIWGRVVTPSLDDDSFWVRVDDGEWVQWNDISHEEQTWHWDDVRPFEMRADRWPVMLSAGTHELRVAYRELGAKIDRVVIASDLDFVPSD